LYAWLNFTVDCLYWDIVRCENPVVCIFVFISNLKPLSIRPVLYLTKFRSLRSCCFTNNCFYC
jgi:hypothetical protein